MSRPCLWCQRTSLRVSGLGGPAWTPPVGWQPTCVARYTLSCDGCHRGMEVWTWLFPDGSEQPWIPLPMVLAALQAG